jgi:membrane fusion protein (multidrug efflux system)
MTRRRTLTIGVTAAVTIALAVLVFSRLTKTDAADSDPTPTAVVTVAPARAETIQALVQAYGTVQADPAGTITIAAPRAVVVGRVLARVGEPVRAGQPLIEVTDAPGAALAYRQAADAATFARNDLARVQRLYDQRLAANDQLGAARKAAADAEAALAQQKAQGSGPGGQALVAPRAGIVTSVTATPGDHSAQDAPLIVIARAGAGTVKLSIEPSAGAVAQGEAVDLYPVFGGPPIRSHITLVGQAADPTTKTIDAVAPLNGANVPIGSAVRGEIVTGAHPGIVVPRQSIVFDETGPHLFTISGGKAHRVFVKAGPDQGDEVEITGPVAAGALVAVEGAYELQDGMAVKARGK